MIDEESRERLLKLMAHLETTTDEQWLMGKVSSKDNKQNCCLGHVFFMGGEDEKLCNDWYNWFENAIATEYMIYPVNDGRHKDYPQSTPKTRILAYLSDVLEGKRKTTYELMDEYMSQTA